MKEHSGQGDHVAGSALAHLPLFLMKLAQQCGTQHCELAGVKELERSMDRESEAQVKKAHEQSVEFLSNRGK